jgi:chemotaxis protein histidine kinase CheA
VELSSDADLQQLFVAELTERSENLLEGARAMREGTLGDDVAPDMVREGHTIKGTGRVMGFNDIASAGLMCEEIWRWVQRGELQPFPALGDALYRLAQVIPRAYDGELTDLASCMHGVIQSLDGVSLPGTLPQPPHPGKDPAKDRTRIKVSFDTPPVPPQPAAVEPDTEQAAAPVEPAVDGEVESDRPTVDRRRSKAGQGSGRRKVDLVALLDEPSPGGPLVFDVTDGAIRASGPEPAPERPVPVVIDVEEAARPVAVPRPTLSAHPIPADPMAYDLGGLIGALQTWAMEESVLVNAGGLYRLINDIATMRIDLEAAAEKTTALARDVAAADPRVADEAEAAAETSAALRRAAVDLEREALTLASVPLSGVTNTLPQLVRYLSKKAGVEVALELVGDDVLVDRQVLERLGDAIRLLVVNAVAHGVERPEQREVAGKPRSGRVAVHATSKGNQLEIVISDDGAGVDWDAVRRVAFERDLVVDPEQVPAEALLGFLYSPEFSTAVRETDIAGDGMGLTRVKEVVEELYGTFVFESTPGRGTRITMTVPTYRALQRALLVTCAGQTWGIPEAAVIEVIPIGAAEISVTETGMRLDWQGEFVPFGSFADVAGLDDEPGDFVIVLSTPIGTAALSIGAVVGTREVAAKELGALLSGPQIVSGAALLGGDDVILLVDAGRLAERLRDLADRPRGPVYKVLVVDDSKGVQQVVAGALASNGFATVVAGSVSEALTALGDNGVHALVVDFSMPRADGVALVHMVRQRYGEMPIVMLSGVANHDDVERAKKAGVDAFFDKSDFRKGALADTLRSLIELGL